MFRNNQSKQKIIRSSQSQQKVISSYPTNQKVIGWIPYWDQVNAVETFFKHKDSFDFISVFWYRLDPDGNIVTYQQTTEDKSIIEFAHKFDIKILAIVANLPDHTENADWDPERVDKVIATDEARKKHISSLVKLVEDKNFDGIDIDYEALKRSQRENFSIFIEELSDTFHKRGKLVGVAMHPKTGEFKPEEDNGSHAQDLERIASAADQLYFMTYLESGFFSEPGPPGSIDWMKSVMQYALGPGKVPREKAFLGIGLMGIEWHQQQDNSYRGINNDLPYEQVLKITQQYKVEPQWDAKARTPHFEYYKGPERHVVWFENKNSFAPRLELAKELGIAGIALWRLGGEDPQIWQKLIK